MMETLVFRVIPDPKEIKATQVRTGWTVRMVHRVPKETRVTRVNAENQDDMA
jgi:hypothetical protein